MQHSDWRYAKASVIGTSHTASNLRCQDYSLCQVIQGIEGNVLVAVVSDGAGSASFSDEGAKYACETFVDWVSQRLSYGHITNFINSESISEWRNQFIQDMQNKAESRSLNIRDFACTLLAAIIGDKQSIFIQVGDGAIVVPQDGKLGEYEVIFWPQNGEYANTTFFITDSQVEIKINSNFKVEGFVEEIAIFTDGIERMALSYKERAAFSPFFDPMFATIRQADTVNFDKLDTSLARFLSSDAVNQRTDDDKTLVLATRRKSQSGNV